MTGDDPDTFTPPPGHVCGSKMPKPGVPVLALCWNHVERIRSTSTVYVVHDLESDYKYYSYFQGGFDIADDETRVLAWSPIEGDE